MYVTLIIELLIVSIIAVLVGHASKSIELGLAAFLFLFFLIATLQRISKHLNEIKKLIDK